jgi:two-component system NtrC family sensor kinase
MLILGSSVANRLVFSYERSVRLAMVSEKGHLLGESMGIAFTHTLLYEEIGLVEETGLLDSFIRDIMKTQELDVRGVMVFDANNRIIAHNDLRAYDKVYDDWHTQQALASRQTLIQQYEMASSQILDIATPLQIGSKRWGTLRFFVGLDRVEVDLAVFAERLVALSVVSVLVGIVLALAVAKRLARPIKKLTAAMQDIDGQLQTDMQADRSDEIGQLQKSFLHMLSRLKTAAQDQTKMQRMLIHAERLASIGTLASGVAHEINNPLAGLRNCLQRIKKNPDNVAQIQSYAQLMLQAVDRMAHIVKGMLDFARREEGEKELFQVGDVLNETVALVDYQFQKNHIVLELVSAKNLPDVLGDAGRIGQVFLNLMMTALDAMPEGGPLRVTCVFQDEGVLTTFQDTGWGISPDKIGRIFDLFFTTKNVGEGTGLGLSIAHGIVEDHKGWMTVESTEGLGTVFQVFLPVGETSLGSERIQTKRDVI